MPAVDVGLLDDSRTNSDPRLRPWIPRAGLPETTVGFDHPLVFIDQQPPNGNQLSFERLWQRGVILGDMRLPSTLKAAGVQRAGSVLILSSVNPINLETALQV